MFDKDKPFSQVRHGIRTIVCSHDHFGESNCTYKGSPPKQITLIPTMIRVGKVTKGLAEYINRAVGECKVCHRQFIEAPKEN